MWNNDGGYDSIGDRGGGFVGNASMGGATQGGGASKSFKKNQNLVPVTISQILGAELVDDGFQMGALELNQVTVVGVVRNVHVETSRIEYTIDDMSGPPIKVKHFTTDDDDLPEEHRTPVHREGTYLRVYGVCKLFNNARTVNAFEVRVLGDMNELTTHLLEVVAVHLRTQQKMQGKGAPAAAAAPQRQQQAAAATEYPGAMQTQQSQQQSGGAGGNSMTPIQNQISEIVRLHPAPEGAMISDIQASLRGLPVSKIKETMEWLAEEGHIYSTIDDDHFKHVDSSS